MHLSVNVGNTVLACPTFGHRIDSVLTENQFLDSSLDPGIHMSYMYTLSVMCFFNSKGGNQKCHRGLGTYIWSGTTQACAHFSTVGIIPAIYWSS